MLMIPASRTLRNAGGRRGMVILSRRQAVCSVSRASNAKVTVALDRALATTRWTAPFVTGSMRRPYHSTSVHNQTTPAVEKSTTGAVAGLKRGEPNNAAIHSSAKNGSASVQPYATAAALTELPCPTEFQLRTLFMTSSIPMVGFGFMDNFIMIQAGGYIDATLGVKFGLATMTAAAMGQIVSDVSGVVFGGTLDSFMHRMGLINPSDLSPAQRLLPICRRTSMAGAVVGVMFGCALGACTLFFMDLKSSEREKRAAELRNILSAMLKDGGEDFMGCEMCTVYLAGEEEEGHKPVVNRGGDDVHIVSLKTIGHDSHAAQCAKTGKLLIDNDVHESGRDSLKTVLCAPVCDDKGSCIAVVEFSNKKLDGSDDSPPRGVIQFTENDARVAKMLARHVGIFINQIN